VQQFKYTEQREGEREREGGKDGRRGERERAREISK
jgi:hypothetical protein